MPTFDGESLIITLDTGVTEVDVQNDLYEAWKDWMLASPNNRKYPAAFRVIGGDPLTAVLTAGAYFFLQNNDGWRIRPPEEDITIAVVGNLAGEDSTLPLLVPTIGDYSVLIVGLQPVTQGVTTSSSLTQQDIADIADGVWDEQLTGATHNIPTSAGRRLRDFASIVVRSELAQGPGTGNNQIQLDTGASAVDGAYDPALIAIVEGTGAGQTRLILEYSGSTKTATVDRNWKVNPDATSLYVISGHPGREHTNEGLAQGGGTDTITLNNLASANDAEYVGMVVSIRSGTGEDQACRIITYNGTTKVAQIARDWNVVPDTTSGYVILPSAVLDIAKFAGVLAGTVWDTNIIDHGISGSFGGELATKADIQASAATDFDQATTANIVYGTNDSGTFTDAASRDGTYWVVGEDASTGLTVQFDFNLPSADHRAGVFTVFGRYTGTPALNHHQELWAYNFEVAAWEQLAEDFMPGGITADNQYSHEFYERHIDRDNNNLVQIRTVHHVTTYNASHAIYFDYVGISSLKITTAEDMAAAVWAAICEGSYTYDDVMKLVSAALAGKLSGAPAGPIYIRDINDTKNRIVATVDANGNRTGITLNVSE